MLPSKKNVPTDDIELQSIKSEGEGKALTNDDQFQPAKSDDKGKARVHDDEAERSKIPDRPIPEYESQGRTDKKIIRFPSEEPFLYRTAPSTLTQEILELIEKGTCARAEEGVGGILEYIESGTAALVVLAADCTPPAKISHLPLVCEANSVPYVYVESKIELGRACGVDEMIVATAISKDDSELKGAILEKVNRFMD